MLYEAGEDIRDIKECGGLVPICADVPGEDLDSWAFGTMAKALAPDLACLTRGDAASSPPSWVSASVLFSTPQSSLEWSKGSLGPGVSRSTGILNVGFFSNLPVGWQPQKTFPEISFLPKDQAWQQCPASPLLPTHGQGPSSHSHMAFCTVAGSTRHLPCLTLLSDSFEFNSLTPSELIGRPRK